MRNYVFIGLLLVMCIVNSCITARCHGYDLNDYRYISFRLGDTLTYVSNKSDTIHLVVIDFFSKGYYEFKAPPDYRCDLDTYYQTDTKQGISIKEHIMYITGARFCNDKAYLRDDEPKDDCEKEELEEGQLENLQLLLETIVRMKRVELYQRVHLRDSAQH